MCKEHKTVYMKNVPPEHLEWAAKSAKDFLSRKMLGRTYMAKDGKSGIHCEDDNHWVAVTYWSD